MVNTPKLSFELFEVDEGVQQGDSLLSLLFNLVRDDALREFDLI